MARKRSGDSAAATPVVGQASVDSVLDYGGVTSPSVGIHLLATFGVLILSLGSLVTGPLLPIPLYSCWGAMGVKDFPRSSSCSGLKLLPSPPLQKAMDIWQCRAYAPWFSMFPIMSALLVTVRVLLTIMTGVFLDFYGRRRVTIVSMGIYVVFATVRTFAPTVEVAIIALVIEGVAVQAAIFALVLIVLENSTQKECMRSVCLILVGHCLSTGGLVPTIHLFLESPQWTQLVKSLPAIGFVFIICFLPESIRWQLSRSDNSDASSLFPKTHNILLDESIKPKLRAVQQESQRCLALIGCRGSSLRSSVCPMFRCLSLFRVLFVFAVQCSVFGLTVGARGVFDPAPFGSFSDRSLSLGVCELCVLISLGLVASRVSVRPLMVVSFVCLAVSICLTPVFQLTSTKSCPGEVLFSLLSHCCCVSTGVSLIVSMGRMCPTHSRGLLIGVCWSLASLCYACAATILRLLDVSDQTMAEYNIKVYIVTGTCLLAGLLGFLLPATPKVLPDSLSHLSSNFKADDFELASPDESDDIENSKL